MKKLAVLPILLIFTLAGYAQNVTPLEEEKLSLEGPYISFTEKSFDFGDITQGDKVEHVFKFKNTGTQPLILSNVMTTCGCTAPQWPREPIAPGEESSMKVIFNSRGKMGRQHKVITVVSNATNNPDKVKIVTNVLPKPVDPDASKTSEPGSGK